MNAYASDHPHPINYGNAFACFCRSNGSFLARWAAADYKKVVLGRTHLAGLKSGNAGSSQW
jgi:hypothetical protein